MRDELPEGWAASSLGELVRPSKKKKEPGEANGLKYIGLEHIESDTNRVVGADDASRAKSTMVTFRPGDVLYSKLRPYLNKVALAPFVGVGSTEILVFEQVPYLDSRYLMHFLSRRETVQTANERANGVQLPRVTFDKIADLDFPLPPLAEQHRIVAKVEALLEEVNRAKARLTKVQAILKRFRQSVLAAACSGRLTNPGTEPDPVPAHWEWKQVGDLIVAGGLFDGARDHGSGTHVAQNLRTADYTTSGVRVVRLENLGHLTFIEDKRTYISHEKYKGLKQNTVVAGDVLVGSFVDQSVRVSLLPKLETPAVTKADCFCVRVRSDLVLPEYLAIQLACDRTHTSLLDEVHGATRPRISTKQLRTLRIPLCSLAEQAEIVRRTADFFALGEAARRRVVGVQERTARLPQAILSKAFSGELVPIEAELARLEGRDYEPASVLLERVKSDAATETTTKRKRVTKGLSKAVA